MTRRLSLVMIALAALVVVGAASAQASSFTASSYPASFTAESAIGNERLTTEIGTFDCGGHFSGSLSESTEALTVAASYKCAPAFGSIPITWRMNECDEVWHTNGDFDFSCPAGKVIEVEYGTAGACLMSIGPQTALRKIALENGLGDIRSKAEVVGIKYTVLKDSLGCPFKGTGAKTGAAYSQSSVVTVQAAGETTLDIG